jgi:hypothetical protein
MVVSKILLLQALLFLLSWTPMTSAQGPFRIGLRGGINFANGSATNFPPESDFSPRNVFGIGGVA